jgi:hypothetical protein
MREIGWDHTQFETREPVLVGSDKVHVISTHSLRNKADEVLTMRENLWIVTRVLGLGVFHLGPTISCRLG